MGTVSNEEKKKFLWGYRDSLRKVERLKAEIEELHTMKMVSSGGSSTRRKGWKSDLSGHVARLDILEKDKERELHNMIRLHEHIEGTINNLEDAREKDVLFYRYIKGMPWWEVIEEMHYSKRQVHRFHSRALIHLDISKDGTQ